MTGKGPGGVVCADASWSVDVDTGNVDGADGCGVDASNVGGVGCGSRVSVCCWDVIGFGALQREWTG